MTTKQDLLFILTWPKQKARNYINTLELTDKLKIKLITSIIILGFLVIGVSFNRNDFLRYLFWFLAIYLAMGLKALGEKYEKEKLGGDSGDT